MSGMPRTPHHLRRTAAPPPSSAIDAVRAFNRFYTHRIGVVGPHLLDSRYSLSEMRVLYELAHRDRATAADLGRELGIDPGYLSRMLRRFSHDGLLRRSPSADDGRRSLLQLSARGRKVFAPFNERAKQDVAAMLSPLNPRAQQDVVSAMTSLTRLLEPASGPSTETFILRQHQPGDMGWVVQRHGELYAREWGYSSEFEALVARIVADFLDQFDPQRERCWIAERGGEKIGCVFLVKKSRIVAKLRLLLVEPSARGLGLGHRLIAECLQFAKQAGYRSITLWTQSELAAARHLYLAAGFTRTEKTPHRSFGKDLVAETWERKL